MKTDGLKPTARIERASLTKDLVVRTRWIGGDVDRRDGIGWGVGMDHGLATRLVEAVNAGVVFGRPRVRRDLLGKTYVFAKWNVHGATLREDLTRLGF